MMMIMPDFPADCLHEIFQYLKDDNASLFDCLMVNRNWCCQAVPLLWRRPFSKLNLNEDVTMPYLLIRTYIYCIPESGKKRLIAAGCERSVLQQTTSFPYPQYLRELDFGEVDEALDIWILGLSYGPSALKFALASEIYELFFSNCRSLWNLRIGQWDDGYRIMDISQMPRIPQVLSELRQFDVCGDFDCLTREVLDNTSNLLTIMSHFSHNIRCLTIDMTSDEDKILLKRLHGLIKMQKNLQYFEYTQEHGSLLDIELTITALSTQADSLTNLVLNALPLNMKCLRPLTKFKNLKMIQFYCCSQMSADVNYCKLTGEIVSSTIDKTQIYDINEQLNVEKLVLLHNSFNYETINLVKMANSILQELVVDNAQPELVKQVIRYCPNLSYLAIGISSMLIPELSKLSSSKIKHLVLGKNSAITALSNEEFKTIGKHLPTSLIHLQIDLTLTHGQLESLLGACAVPIMTFSVGFEYLEFEKCELVLWRFVKRLEGFKEFRIKYKDMPMWEWNFLNLVEKGRGIGVNVNVENEIPFIWKSKM